MVAAGDLVATLTLDDCESISTARPFLGSLPDLAKPQVHPCIPTMHMHSYIYTYSLRCCAVALQLVSFFLRNPIVLGF